MAMNRKTKWRIGLKGAVRVLQIPEYVIAALVFAALILLVLQWFFSIDLLQFVFSTPVLSLRERIEFILSGYANIFANITDFRVVSIVLISLLLGGSLSVLLYAIKRSNDYLGSQGHVRSVALTLFGSGCAACGGSVIAPLLTGFGSAAALSISTVVGGVVLVVALVLAVLSLRDAGVEAARTIAMERENHA